MKEIKEFEIVCEKYGVKGILYDIANHSVVKLEFTYGGRKIEMGLPQSFFYKNDFIGQAKAVMESYIERQKSNNRSRKTKMYEWYIDNVNSVYGDYKCLHGLVSGHDRLQDSIDTHTSEVLGIMIDYVENECVVQTRNTTYYCPLAYCDFDTQDKTWELVPDYEIIKEIYYDTIKKPKIEPGKVLLVVANWRRYYFDSLFYQPIGEEAPVPIICTPHIGTFQDSVLIRSVSDRVIDIRYFPHFENMEFYSEDTDGCPWYIENIGDADLYFRTSKGVIKVGPGERKEVCEGNEETDKPILPGGDLYPAEFLF